MKRSQITALLLFMFGMTLLLIPPLPAQAITVSTGFGPGGEAGEADYDGDGFSDFPITLFGIETSAGDVFQLDAFLYLDSDGNGTPDDLNGGFDGVTAQLSVDPLPTDLDYGFGYTLPDDSNLLLTYTFTNNTGSVLSNLRFFSFLDAEIIETDNTFFNEYGDTTGPGTLGSGSADANPDEWEIDDPQNGNLYGHFIDDDTPISYDTHLFNGGLDDTNSITETSLNDVALALGFYLGALNPLDVATITMLISTDGSQLGDFALFHFDSLSTDKNITFSGQSSVFTPGPEPVPEPGTWLLMGTGIMSLAALRFRLRRKVR